jgi:hypothetical protein
MAGNIPCYRALRAGFRKTAREPLLRRRALVAFAALLSAPAAHAARADNAQLQAFTRTPFYAGLINRALAVLPPAIFHKCPTLRSPGSQVIELSPVAFAQDGYPSSGMWQQRFPVTGCGNDTVLNFYFVATADEKVNTILGIPGETHADLRLQRDAQTYALIGAKLQAKSCPNFDTINSAYNGADAPAMVGPAARHSLPPPWSETWTLQGCGRRFHVGLRFVPNASGTQIVQHGGAELP